MRWREMEIVRERCDGDMEKREDRKGGNGVKGGKGKGQIGKVTFWKHMCEWTLLFC